MSYDIFEYAIFHVLQLRGDGESEIRLCNLMAKNARHNVIKNKHSFKMIPSEEFSLY